MFNVVERKQKQGETRSSPYTYRVCYYAYFIPLPSSSFKIRFRKSLTIRGNPSLSGTFGSQFSSSFALLISGFLIWGSSAVFDLYSIVALESIVSLTTCVQWEDVHKTITLISAYSPELQNSFITINMLDIRLRIQEWTKFTSWSDWNLKSSFGGQVKRDRIG